MNYCLNWKEFSNPFLIGLQILSRLDRPEVATVPGIVFWLLESESMHRYPATFQLRVIPMVDKHINDPFEEHLKFRTSTSAMEIIF